MNLDHWFCDCFGCGAVFLTSDPWFAYAGDWCRECFWWRMDVEEAISAILPGLRL